MEALDTERAHYEEHSPYLLHFLERDDGPLSRWLIRQVLKSWDRQIAFLPAEAIRDKVVFEIGCGNPRMLFYFKEMGAREAIGCDLARRFTERGLSRERTYVHTASLDVEPDGIRLLFGDVFGPLTADLEVDTVVCFQALHHLPLDDFVSLCARLVRPGGWVLISDPVGDHPLRAVGNAVGRFVGTLSPGEAAYPPETVRAGFEQGGFELAEMRSLNPTTEILFQITELAASLPSRVRFLAKLPVAALRPLDDAIERALLGIFPRLGWRYFMAFRRSV